MVTIAINNGCTQCGVRARDQGSAQKPTRPHPTSRDPLPVNTPQLRIAELETQANRLQQQGQHPAAMALWQQLLDVAPDHALAATHVGAQALARGDLARAEVLLEQAARATPALALTHAQLSRLRSAQGKPEAALAAIDRAIGADPVAWGPHMERARLLEAAGNPRAAAMSWSNALSYMPAQLRQSPQLQALVTQAETAIRNNQELLHAHLSSRMQPFFGQQERRALRRFDHCLDVVTGRRPFVTARPLMLPFPELPAIPYFDGNDFPWVAEFETCFPAILDELNTALAHGTGFVPYVRTRPGDPPAQFAALDHSLDWGAYFLWKDGTRIDANADACPRTEAALRLAPQDVIPGRAPVAFFSALKPGTHIPPHNGATNTRLTVHLPLIIPPDCALRVGEQTHVWEPGKLVLFDDTIRHEAWNNSSQLRVVLIFSVWNPLLTEIERTLVSETVQGMLEFYGDDADLGEL